MHPLNETTAFNLHIGEVAEWSIAPVLKTDVLKGTGGSNPSLSAIKQNKADFSMKSAFFVYKSQKRNLLQINYKAVIKQEKWAHLQKLGGYAKSLVNL